MKVEVIQEAGAEEALFGLGLSYGLTSGRKPSEVYTDEKLSARLVEVAGRLAHKSGGHNKFLRQVSVWIDITAPLYFWQEMATYGVGNTFQSESTMHTIWKGEIYKCAFENYEIPDTVLEDLNVYASLIRESNETKEQKNEYFMTIKRLLPSGYLQRRIMSTNYMALQNICAQRKNHRLPEWHTFIDAVYKGLIFRGWVFPEAAEC